MKWFEKIVDAADLFASTVRGKTRKIRSIILEDRRADLAVLSIMKNESLNVLEWIDHYIWQGVDHIYIIDNGSSDDMIEKIECSPHRGRVTLIQAPEKHQQKKHYRRAIASQKIKKKFRWLLIVDADEFCFPLKHRTITEALQGLDWFDLIYMQWTYFGCPDQAEHPSSLRTDLIYRQDDLGPHIATKFFVKTSRIGRKSVQIHKFRGARSERTITANDVFQLNHYQTQSLHFWKTVKMTRGDADIPAWEFKRSMQDFNDFNAKAVVRDELLAKRVMQAKG